MEVYIIRHTKVALAKGICYGQTDVGLADTFEEEYFALKDQLPNHFDAVFSSPLMRCRQLAEKFSTDMILDDRLKEMHFGDWELKAWNDIPLDEIQPWYDDFASVSTPNGENFEQLFTRCVAFINYLRSQPFEKVLLVTHSGFIRSIWAYLLDIPLQNTFKIPIGFGEVLQIYLGYKEDYIIQTK